MAKLFLGLAIIVTLAAAVLGFLGKDKIDKLQGVLKETRQTLARTESTLERTKTDLAKTTEDLTAEKAKVEAQTTEIAGLKKEKEDTVLKLASAEMARDKAEGELKDIQTKLAAMNPGGAPGAPDPAAMATELATAKADLEKANNDLAVEKQMVASLNRNKAEFDEKLSTANKEIERYRTGVTRQGLTGKVLAVNPGWNFVVLSVGDRQGAATGGVMIVTRGGEAIGRVRITSIEPSTSIADILPGSVRRGVTVQPGDAVVYEGPRTKPTPSGGNNLAAPAPAAGVQ
jgi:hypothetical protein